MSRDEVVSGVLVVAFATLVTAHVTLVAFLATRPPRWRAAAALIVAPLAPIWGWRESRKRSVVWIASLVLYGLALALASR
jgi:ABC-type uncharacterized transport system permease subunit